MMFVNEFYSLRKLAGKLRVPGPELEKGLRRLGARPVRDGSGRPAYTYEAVWEYVHRLVNDERYAAWEHETDTVTASQLSAPMLESLLSGLPPAAAARLRDIAVKAGKSAEVRFVLQRILRIDPECPACGRFPWIVGYDGRLADRGQVFGIYVCPSCGHLFLRR